jgi:hypothetical protein
MPDIDNPSLSVSHEMDVRLFPVCRRKDERCGHTLLRELPQPVDRRGVYGNLVAPRDPDASGRPQTRVRHGGQDRVEHAGRLFLTGIADVRPALTVGTNMGFERGMQHKDEPSDDVSVKVEKPVYHGFAANLYKQFGDRAVEPGSQTSRWNDQK